MGVWYDAVERCKRLGSKGWAGSQTSGDFSMVEVSKRRNIPICDTLVFCYANLLRISFSQSRSSFVLTVKVHHIAEERAKARYSWKFRRQPWAATLLFCFAYMTHHFLQTSFYFTASFCSHHSNIMDPPGRSRLEASRPLLPKLSSDDGVRGRMVPIRSGESPENESSTPSLVDRVRSIASRRRPATAPPTSGGSNDAGANMPASNLQGIATERQLEPEQSFLDTCLHHMNHSNPLKDRLAAIKLQGVELESHSVHTVMTILGAIEDLAGPDAQLEARMACYELLRVVSLHPGLEAVERIRIFRMVTTSIPPAHCKPQLSALKALLQSPHTLQTLQSELLPFLVQTLDHIFAATIEARSALKKSRSRRTNDPIAEEEALGQLLDLIQGLATDSSGVLVGEQFSQLIGKLNLIANKTTVHKDLNQVAAIIASVTESQNLPSDKLESTIDVLSGIACTTHPQAGESTWQAFSHLFHSSDRVQTLAYLMNILLLSPADRQSVVVRGALLTIKHLVEANSEGGLPAVPLQGLLKSLPALSSISSRLRIDCLQFLITCLGEGTILQSLDITDPEDWSQLCAVIYDRSEIGQKDRRWTKHCQNVGVSSPFHSFVVNRLDHGASTNEEVKREQVKLAFLLESQWASLGTMQRGCALSLLLHLGSCFDNDIALHLALDHIREERLTLPPTGDWFCHLAIVSELCTLDSSKPTTIRSRGLDFVAETVQVLKESPDHPHTIRCLSRLSGLIHFILEEFLLASEQDIAIINILAEIGAEFSWNQDIEVFKATLTFLVHAAKVEVDGPTHTSGPAAPRENRAATYLVWMFLQCLQYSATKAKLVFDTVLLVARDKAMPTDARLTVMKLLTRIRCNSILALKIVSVPDSLNLAATLYRTETSSHMQAKTAAAGSSKASTGPESPGARTGRSSGLEQTKSTRSRSTTRSGGARDRSLKAVPPLWMYPGSKGLPIEPSQEYSTNVFLHANDYHRERGEGTALLAFRVWFETILIILRDGSDWEIYSYILVHLPSQLSNVALFANQMESLQTLHKLITVQLRNGSFHEPPASTGVKKGDIAVCLYHSLTALVVYHEHFRRDQLDETVRTFLAGIGMWDRAAKCCIHALTLCSHEIPSNLRRYILAITQKMAQIITQSHLAIDILEFLAGVVQLPEAYQIAGPEGQDFLRTIFGICIGYIHHYREQRQKEKVLAAPRSSYSTARFSGLSSRSGSAPETNRAIDAHEDLQEYVFTLAYHAITFWFLAIDLRERSKHVGWIVKNLTWKDEDGKERMEDQSQVLLDMIHRTAYNDLGETKANEDFGDANGPIAKATWLYGMSIITLETVQETGLTQITKRQASGTTHAMYQQYTAPLPPHHIEMPSTSVGGGADSLMKVFPQHVLLQLGFTIAPVPIPLQPILLPEDDFIKRAISSFDRNDTVDGHKAGVIYIATGQESEAKILANTRGTRGYEQFLARLGTRVRLQEAVFNTQGLDRINDTDGTHTYAWRDRVTEIVFHVTTMMPTNVDEDPHCISKKRHIGNDFVNIIYNDSGLPFDFDTFTSQLNYVNIVITPETVNQREADPQVTSVAEPSSPEASHVDGMVVDETYFFTVQTVVSPLLPQISHAATPKVVSANVLPGFVRQIALNASVFSLVWSNRDGGENVSSWRNRLREIMKLRERYANTGTSANVAYPGMGTASDRGGAPSYVEGDEWRGNLAMAGLAEQPQFLYSADFTRWN